jgi:hypothetical protein
VLSKTVPIDVGVRHLVPRHWAVDYRLDAGHGHVHRVSHKARGAVIDIHLEGVPPHGLVRGRHRLDERRGCSPMERWRTRYGTLAAAPGGQAWAITWSRSRRTDS